jgi:hypothetical protein
VSATLSEPMPKRKPLLPSDADAGKKTTMKVSVATLRKARIVSEHRGIDLFDYIASLLDHPIDRDYRSMIEEEAKRLDK